MLPVPVLERCAADMPNYQARYVSHGDESPFKGGDGIIMRPRLRLRRVLSIPDNYKVLVLQGGAYHPVCSDPDEPAEDRRADYALTGSFASKACMKAQKFGDMHAASSSKETNFDHVPTQDELDIRPMPTTLHLRQHHLRHRVSVRSRRPRQALSW